MRVVTVTVRKWGGVNLGGVGVAEIGRLKKRERSVLGGCECVSGARSSVDND